MNNATAAGENIHVLRKVQGKDQSWLSREMGISASYLRKLEHGERPVTPQIAAAAARALRVRTARIWGQPFTAPVEHSQLLDDLREALRRHTLPKEDTPPLGELAAGLREAADLRSATRYVELLRILPRLLGQATSTAMDAGGDAVAWGQVADLYGCAYAVAHRMGEPDLADMIVSRQAWASRQSWNPVAEAATAWNEAGTFQSAGQYDDGLSIVERAISAFEQAGGSGPEYIVTLGSLHLRGIVLASRHRDQNATDNHLRHAKRLVDELGAGGDVLRHNLTFGQGNTALYELAAHIELDAPDRAATMADPLLRTPPAGLAPSRVGRLAIDAARASLAINKVQDAERHLKQAFDVAPQMAELHPMSREVLRVLVVMHQRSKPDLVAMAKRAGLAE
ncbi:helix-turn-helix domain-containing protein [Streptomyces alboflavus]|uniref:helix-turn-helix domain-containing protein n=1 Tax=Streptomyces alboflavus TaxID=67267 RepID=UPI000F65750B|nr:helix-turn-helix transcriptional regulator [Streptomyces alboflavus]